MSRFPEVEILEATMTVRGLQDFIPALFPGDGEETHSPETNALPFPSLRSCGIWAEDAEASESDLIDVIANMLEIRHNAGGRLQSLTIGDGLLDESRYRLYVPTIYSAEEAKRF